MEAATEQTLLRDASMHPIAPTVLDSRLEVHAVSNHLESSPSIAAHWHDLHGYMFRTSPIPMFGGIRDPTLQARTRNPRLTLGQRSPGEKSSLSNNAKTLKCYRAIGLIDLLQSVSIKAN